jgi:hypothetical protein
MPGKKMEGPKKSMPAKNPVGRIPKNAKVQYTEKDNMRDGSRRTTKVYAQTKKGYGSSSTITQKSGARTTVAVKPSGRVAIAARARSKKK